MCPHRREALIDTVQHSHSLTAMRSRFPAQGCVPVWFRLRINQSHACARSSVWHHPAPMKLAQVAGTCTDHPTRPRRRELDVSFFAEVVDNAIGSEVTARARELRLSSSGIACNLNGVSQRRSKQLKSCEGNWGRLLAMCHNMLPKP